MNKSPIARTLAPLVDLSGQAALFRNPSTRWTFLFIALALVFLQQRAQFVRSESPDDRYRNMLNLGVNYRAYFPFFYYFGGFPVNLQGPAGTREQADAQLREAAARLRSSERVYNRATIFFFYPDTWLGSPPDAAEMRTAHAIWFTAALLAIVVAFWATDKPLLGLLLAILCGSNPFEVYEVYHRGQSNVFATVISTGLMVTAICVVASHRTFGQRRWLVAALVALTGVIAALQNEVRLEGVGVFAGELLAIALLWPQSKRDRLLWMTVFVVTLAGSSYWLNRYFDGRFAEANRIVTANGGTDAPNNMVYYGTPWWALWSGLGDFDETYGFLADDRAGLSYHYSREPSMLDEVTEPIHRRNYQETILNDPIWFADIIYRRFKRALTENAPPRVSWGARSIDLPVLPGAATLVAGLALVAGLFLRRWELIGYFLVPLTIGLVALAQLADYGLQFYSVIHLFVLAYAACLVIELLLMLVKQDWSR